eukprot:1084152-Pleurochrysis_carterae.AAC.2
MPQQQRISPRRLALGVLLKNLLARKQASPRALGAPARRAASAKLQCRAARQRTRRVLRGTASAVRGAPLLLSRAPRR